MGLKTVTPIPPYHTNKSLLANTEIPPIEEDVQTSTTIMFKKNARSLYPHIQILGIPDPGNPKYYSRPFYFTNKT